MRTVNKLRPAAIFCAILALAITSVLLPGCDSGRDKPADTGRDSSLMNGVSSPSMRVIPFSVAAFDGGVFDLTAAPERVTVINFWASWCGPCRLEAQVLERAYKEYGPRGVDFIGVAIQDTDEGSKRFISEFGLTFPNGPDSTGSIMRDYRVFGIPKTYVIAPGGAVSYSHTGPVSWPDLSAELEGLL